MTAKRIPGLPAHVQQFLCCLLMHVGAPFLPIGLEKLLTNAVDARSLMLFVTMYALAIGVTSVSILYLALSLVVGVVYAAGYGAVVKGTEATVLTDAASFVVAIIVVIHALERFNRHVVDRESFWEFGKR